MDTAFPNTEVCLGRDRELEQIDELLVRASSGTGCVALIEGPPGIGKTVLIAEATRRALRLDVTVLSASGGVLEREYPFGVVRDLFTSAVSDRDGAVDLFAGAAGLAAGPLGLRGPAAEDARGWGEPAAAAMYGLYWLSVKLADAGPLLIAIDDLHWADLMSLQFVLYLVRRLEGLSVLLLLAAHGTAERSQAGDLLAQLRGRPGVELLRPAPLSERDAARVIGLAGMADASDEFVAACHQASGGNPFLLRELLTALRADEVNGSAADAARVTSAAPERIARWVSARVLTLGGDAERLAIALSVLGAGATLAEAASLARLDPEAAATAADALLAADIIAEVQPFQFAHPVVAGIVYDGIPPATRAEAHARAARLCAARGAPVARVAAHLLAAGPDIGDWGVGMLRRAAHEATARGAPGAAATYLESALLGAKGGLRADLLVQLGESRLRAGLADAIDPMREALELQDDPRLRAKTCLSIGRALFAKGEYAAARQTFRRGLEALGDSQDDLFLELFAWCVTDADHDLHLPAAAQARVRRLLESDAPGESPIERRLLAQVAYASARSGERRHDEVARIAHRALADGRLLHDGDDSLAPYAAACFALVTAGAPSEAARELTKAITMSQRRGWLLAFGWFSHMRGIANYSRGNVTESFADVEIAVATYAQSDAEPLPDTVAIRALCLLERDDLQGATEALGLPAEASAGQGSSCAFMYALGRLRAATGQPRQALEALMVCQRLTADQRSPNPAAHFPWRCDAALLAAHLGDREAAETLIAENLRLARAFGAPAAIAMSLRTSALIEGGRAAHDHLAEAAALLEGAGLPLQLARVLVDHGAAIRRAGRRREALDQLRRGLDLAAGCGALALAKRARAELIAAGARPRRDRSWGVDALTASELRVAQMAAEGMSNPQIAQALFITRKTVTVHLSRIYQKLGISGRSQLAQSLGQRTADQVPVLPST